MNNNLKYGLIALGTCVIGGTIITYRKRRPKKEAAEQPIAAIATSPETEHDKNTNTTASADGTSAAAE